MPARDAAGRPRNGRLPDTLLWTGAGLAPVAALLLVVGDSNGTLRTAAVLALLVVVLIGLSVGLRENVRRVRLDLEALLDEEIEELRASLRGEIAATTRDGHDALADRLRVIQGAIDMLRRQVETAQANAAAAGRLLTGGVPESGLPRMRAAEARPPARSVEARASARVAGAAGAAWSPHPAPTGAGAPAGYAPDGAFSGADSGRAGFPEADDRFGHLEPYPEPAGEPRDRDRAGAGEPYRIDTPFFEQGFPAAEDCPTGGAPEPGRSPRGVVRHTETVRVTTRHTVVGANGHGSDQTPSGELRSGSGRRTRGGDPDGDGTHWGGSRARDRWAGLRGDETGDETGDELRVGERRATLRADGSGTELRIEDRWAAVRRGGPGRPPARGTAGVAGTAHDAGVGTAHDAGAATGHGPGGDRYGGLPEHGATGRTPGGDWRSAFPRARWSGEGAGTGGNHGAPPALPAESAEPSWSVDAPAGGYRPAEGSSDRAWSAGGSSDRAWSAGGSPERSWSEWDAEREPAGRRRRHRDDDEPSGTPVTDPPPSRRRWSDPGRPAGGWR